MAHMALALPSLLTQPIPLLAPQRDASISLTQRQIACLMCNAFFCTFPLHGEAEFFDGPDTPPINFTSLFCSSISPAQMAKLTFLLHYFDRVCHVDREPDAAVGTLTFHRQVLPRDAPIRWDCSQNVLCDVLVHDGSIEDAPHLIRVDFANKYIGGGVLSHGAVQEEILFVLYPELIISRLFTCCLKAVSVRLAGVCRRVPRAAAVVH